MGAVFSKEIKVYFSTLIGYVFVCIFLLISGLFFNSNNIEAGSASVSGTFGVLSLVLILVTPVLTMRLLAEEQKSKTDQVLLTSPTSIASIVSGKFFAALFVLGVALSITLTYAIIIAVFGHAFLWEFVLGYLGVLLSGAIYIAVGLFISSVSENQLSAALATYAVLILLWVPTMILPTVDDALIKGILNILSIYSNISVFQSGILSVSSLVYMLSFTFVFLFLTVKMIDRRRWAKG